MTGAVLATCLAVTFTPAPASAAHSFTAANARTALDAFQSTYYNASNGSFYGSTGNHTRVDLWTSAYIRQGLCNANNATGVTYTYKQYASMMYDWVRQWIQPDGSILNGTNGSLTGYYDRNHYMMNVGLLADGAAAMYKDTGNASYISDAVRVIDWGRNRFTIPYNGVQILWPQWLTANGGVHYDRWVDGDDGQNTVAKGIMSRGIINFMNATGQTQYMQWMEDNAQTAWNNRHLSDNVLYTNWQVPNTLPSNAYSPGQFTGVDIMYRVLGAQAGATTPYTARNFSFEDNNAATPNPSNWIKYNFGNSANDAASFVETKGSLSRTGTYILTHYKNAPYQIYTYQTVTGLVNGTYNLSAWVRSTGGQTASYMAVKDYGGGPELIADARQPSDPWHLITINNVPVTNGQATIGFYSNAGANQWLNIDDVNFARH